MSLPTFLTDPRKTRVLFGFIAVAEAFSWAGLLIGMYFKWIAESTEAGVKLFGPIHGGIFVAYVLITLLTAHVFRWSHKTTLAALVCSIPPFATAVFEVWAVRRGKLDPAAIATPAS